VPKDDRFQVINEHDSENFAFDQNYLDIRRSADLVIIQITWNEGRTVEQKKALYKAIADGLEARLSLRREDVFVSLIEVKRENWSFGGRNRPMRVNYWQMR
jgi:4-oxalocrotonate tautomerase